MIALIILAVVALWAALGYLLWKWTVGRIPSRWVKVPLTIILAAIWFVGPVLDEILGAREFNRLCAEIPPIKFHGPVAIGPGAYFDEQGNPRWKTSEEFSAIRRNSKEWDEVFDVRQEREQLQSWVVPIGEVRTIDFVRDSGMPVVESYYRISAGGWLKRTTGWGIHAPYHCRAKGRFPNDEELIVFKRN